jgi:hypothetical protein
VLPRRGGLESALFASAPRLTSDRWQAKARYNERMLSRPVSKYPSKKIFKE